MLEHFRIGLTEWAAKLIQFGCSVNIGVDPCFRALPQLEGGYSGSDIAPIYIRELELLNLA